MTTVRLGDKPVALGAKIRIPVLVEVDGGIRDLTGATVYLIFAKPDRTTFQVTCVIGNVLDDDGVLIGNCYYDTTSATFSAAGANWSVSVRLVQGTIDNVSVPPVRFTVQDAPRF